jgi:hypothetical protein
MGGGQLVELRIATNGFVMPQRSFTGSEAVAASASCIAPAKVDVAETRGLRRDGGRSGLDAEWLAELNPMQYLGGDEPYPRHWLQR